MKKLLAKLPYLLLIIYCAMLIFSIKERMGSSKPNEFSFWDYEVYYYCAKANMQGINSYDTAAVEKMAEKNITHYVYPPITLLFFRPIAKFDYKTAANIYLFLKLILMIFIIYLWRNFFLDKKVDFIFYLLCLFSFNAAVYLDFEAGNITILEQFFLWLGFFYYTRNRLWLFGLFVMLASIFKIHHIVFLFLLLLKDNNKKYFYLGVQSFIFFFVMVAQFFIYPFDYMMTFVIRTFLKTKGGGGEDPCIPAFINDLSLYVSEHTKISLNSSIIYLLVTIVIMYLSFKVFKRLMSYKEKDRDKIIIFFACLTYALIMPRFKDYYYCLLIPAAYYIIKHTKYLKPAMLAFVIMLIANNYSCLKPLSSLIKLCTLYSPLIITIFLWILFRYDILNKDKKDINIHATY